MLFITNELFTPEAAQNFYFWVDDENMRVQATAVIYQRRDQLARLADMEWEHGIDKK